ncbi:hypothetical protein NQ317_014784 [Molorchus minor]|uniref:Integrase catalytic domain-containing protein n=1 Tax=Molorchus minor TaxID=1323400 RepID=A0ABQ9J9J4_9CUCU|nr:hypothetical protein NQ317_014784 [Molorchus minor]
MSAAVDKAVTLGVGVAKEAFATWATFRGGENWTVYSERLEQYFSANQVDDAKKKVATLISLIGTETYKLLRSLCHPQLPKDKTYDQLVELLRKQCSPHTSSWRERIKFHEANQSRYENIGEWFVRIKTLAVNCEFGSDLTVMLKDKFITGLKKSKILDRLCEEEVTKPLEDLVRIAMQKESAISHVEEVRHVSKYPPRQITGNGYRQPMERMPFRNQSFQPRNMATHGKGQRNFDSKQMADRTDGRRRENISVNIKNKGCVHCGKNHGGKCKYEQYFCNKCKTRGHLATMCKRRNHYNNFMENEDIVVEELNESQNIYAVNRLYGDKENQFRVNIVIDDRVHNVQIDSGASISACSELTYKQYFHDYPLRNDNIVLRGYDGKNLKILGQFQCRVLYKTQTHVVRFYVIRDGGPMIVGRDFLLTFKLNFQTVNSISENKMVNTLIEKYKDIFSDKPGFKFIQNISTLLKPIYNLLKKDQNFRWTQECNQAFEEIKRKIAEDIVLVHYNPTLPLMSDFLSRAPLKVQMVDPEYEGKGEYLNLIKSNDDWPIDSKAIMEETQKDAELQEIIKYLETNSFSKYPVTYLMNKITAEETEEKTTRLLCHARNTRYDSNRQWRNGICHITSPVGHQQSNGQAENAVKTFKSKLKAALDDPDNKNVKLTTLISRFLLAYRNAEHATTRETPAKLLFGRKLRDRYDLLRSQPEKPRKETDNIHRSKRKQGRREKSSKVRKFSIGDLVMTRDYRTVNRTQWTPAIIIKKIGKSTYLTKLTEEGRIWKRHANQIIRRTQNKGSETRLSRDNEEYPPYQQVNCQEQTISRIAYRPMHVNDNPNVHTPGNGTKSVSSVVTMDDGTGENSSAFNGDNRSVTAGQTENINEVYVDREKNDQPTDIHDSDHSLDQSSNSFLSFDSSSEDYEEQQRSQRSSGSEKPKLSDSAQGKSSKVQLRGQHAKPEVENIIPSKILRPRGSRVHSQTHDSELSIRRSTRLRTTPQRYQDFVRYSDNDDIC